MKKQILIITVLFSMVVNAAGRKELSIQQRLAKIEAQLLAQPQSRDNTAEVVLQNQQLQQQIAELKGVIEEQNYQIQNLKEKQKLLYIDIDTRLVELESQTGGHDLTRQPVVSDNANNQAQTVEVDEGYDNSGLQTQVIQDKPKLSSYQDDYDIAFAHLRAGRFLVSARAFEGFIQNHPQNELTDNAYYWLGESYYVKRQYPQALAAFLSLTNKFPNSSKAPDSWLKIGYSYYEMDDLVKADENLQQVIDSYPNTSIARLAKNRLMQLRRDN